MEKAYLSQMIHFAIILFIQRCGMIICSKKNKLRLFITDFFREGQDSSFHHECEARVVKTAVLTRAKKSVMKSAYFLFEHVIFF